MSSSLRPIPLEPCARTARGAGCDVEPCGMCGARAFSICNAVEDHELSALARATTLVEFPAGRVFIEEGEPSRHVFNVTSGAVKLYKLLADGRRQVVGFLSIGDFIGFGPREAAPFTAEALTPVRACRFERRVFRTLLDEFPALESRLLGLASDELAAAQEQMVLLGRKSAAERLASFLIGRSRAARRVGRPDDILDLPMTRGDIADYLGLTTETVSRLFSQLRKGGQIRLESVNTVILADRAALQRIAGR